MSQAGRFQEVKDRHSETRAALLTAAETAFVHTGTTSRITGTQSLLVCVRGVDFACHCCLCLSSGEHHCRALRVRVCVVSLVSRPKPCITTKHEMFFHSQVKEAVALAKPIRDVFNAARASSTDLDALHMYDSLTSHTMLHVLCPWAATAPTASMHLTK